jgi:hypothetical protein
MAPRVIFRPVVVLVMWTLLVLLSTGIVRVRAVLRRRLKPSDFKLGESPRVPEDVAVVNRNLMNLLEAPGLFYVACVVAFLTRQVDTAVLVLAWSFVALRLLHSAVHLSYNHIGHRLVLFASSGFVLTAMWVRLAIPLFAG